MEKFEIIDNTLIRCEMAFTCEGGMFYEKKTTVITKEEFIACYKAWIEGEEEKEVKAIETEHSCVTCKFGNLYADSEPCCNCTEDNDMYEPNESEADND